MGECICNVKKDNSGLRKASDKWREKVTACRVCGTAVRGGGQPPWTEAAVRRAERWREGRLAEWLRKCGVIKQESLAKYPRSLYRRQVAVFLLGKVRWSCTPYGWGPLGCTSVR